MSRAVKLLLWWSDYPDPLQKCRDHGHAPPLRRQQNLSQDLQDLATRILGPAHVLSTWSARMRRRIFRHPPTSAATSFPAFQPRRRRGGFQRGRSRARRGLRAPASPSLSRIRCGLPWWILTDWVARNRAAAKPVPASRSRSAREASASRPVYPAPDGLINPLPEYDFGSTFNYNDLSGVISVEPPRIKQNIPLLVPKVDADGIVWRVPACCGNASGVSGLERYGRRFQQRQNLRLGGRSTCPSRRPGGAANFGRSAAVTGGTLPESRHLCRGCQGCRGKP